MGAEAEIAVGGKRLRCRLDDLAPLAPGSAPAGGRSTRPASAEATDLGVAQVDRELKLIGERVEPALAAVDGYLDRAARSSVTEVRIVHGHGSGRLRQAVREHLRGHPLVAAQRPGAPNEGGNGATVVSLRD